jgi:hypothetical protein
MPRRIHGGRHASPSFATPHWHRRCGIPCQCDPRTGPGDIGTMADLQKLLFETQAKISDREVLATARLNARVKAFAGRMLSDDVLDQINHAVADEADRLVAEGVLRERPDWLAVIVGRRLHVAFGSRAVQQLSRELKRIGVI